MSNDSSRAKNCNKTWQKTGQKHQIHNWNLWIKQTIGWWIPERFTHFYEIVYENCMAVKQTID